MHQIHTCQSEAKSSKDKRNNCERQARVYKKEIENLKDENFHLKLAIGLLVSTVIIILLILLIIFVIKLFKFQLQMFQFP